ncbi:inner membrane-spanning protein YciB [Glycocaulis abyssi]|uniref:Inner membrane-spanning protein YciB n=1 Tax=Glycocaulis abyssi TaxID=1433403 RepID=A0ABV9NC57_9PROT
MSTNGKTIGQGARLLVDVGPAAVFMISYNIANRVLDEGAIYWSTGLFMAATAIALAYAAISQKRFPPMLVVTFVIVTLFGAMTIYLQDPIFIFIKPTIINLLFAFTILFSFAFGFNVWKALFSSVFEMPERIWTILAIRWALFFIFLAAVNEVLWRHITDSVVVDSARMFDWLELSEAFWVNFRLLGTYPIFAVFVALNIPITLKWARAPGEGDDEEGGDASATGEEIPQGETAGSEPDATPAR